MSNKSLHCRDFIYNEDIKKNFHPLFVRDYAYVEECLLPVGYKKYAEDVLSFEVRDDDVFVCSFPKCGTTWAQEMVWCIGNDLDFERAKEPLQKRFPFLEMSSVVHVPTAATATDTLTNTPDLPDYYIDTLEYARCLPGQRYMKTHMPLQLLPRQLQTPRREAKHILGYWDIRHEPNMLFITYEEMKIDLPAVIQRVADFLHKPLPPNKIEELTNHLSFESMKKNESVNHDGIANKLRRMSGSDGNFMRSGRSGVFLKDLTEDEIDLLNCWCKKNLEGTDYILPKY